VTVRPWLWASLLAGLFLAASAVAEEWSTGPRAPASAPRDTTAVSDEACREFQGAEAPPEAGQEPGSPAQATERANRGGQDARGVAPSGKGQPPATGRRALYRIPYLISLLCQDRAANRDAIASLYQVLKGDSTPSAPSPGAALPDCDPARAARNGSVCPAGPAGGATTAPERRASAKLSRPQTGAAAKAPRSADEALAVLEAAADRFIALRVDNEIESNLREKIWTTTDNGQVLHARFASLLASVQAGQMSSQLVDNPKANQELVRIVALLDTRTEALGGPKELADFHETQAAWRAYRDAWLTFIQVAHPELPQKAFANALTAARCAELRAFYATGD
jgi:hypothetical protein